MMQNVNGVEPVVVSCPIVFNQALTNLVFSSVYSSYPIVVNAYRKDFVPETDKETAQISIGEMKSVEIAESGEYIAYFTILPRYEEAFRNMVDPLVRVLGFVDRENADNNSLKRFVLTTKERNDAAIEAAKARKAAARPQRQFNRNGRQQNGARKNFNGPRKTYNK